MQSKKHVNLLFVVFTGIALTICTSNTLTAQKKETTTSKSNATAKKSVSNKSKGRLPNHYGKLNLTTDQRTKVYQIQSEYKSQIDSLKKQLAALNNKRNSECAGVLTSIQKSTLDKILADVASKRSKKTAKN